jgi:hypothetical protein
VDDRNDQLHRARLYTGTSVWLCSDGQFAR